MYVSSQFKLVIPVAHVRFIRNNHPFAIVALKGFALNLLTRQSSSRMELFIASVVAVDPTVSSQPVITARANALGVPAFQLVSDDLPIDSKPIDPEAKQPSRMNIVLQPLFIRYDALFFSGLGNFFSGPSITDDELLHTDPPTVLPPDSILSVDIPSFRVVIQASEPVVMGTHVSTPFTPSRSPLHPKAIHFGEDPRPRTYLPWDT